VSIRIVYWYLEGEGESYGEEERALVVVGLSAIGSHLCDVG
jgi:hypothetical protein